MSLQDKIGDVLKINFKNFNFKKINKDNFFDVFFPDINEKKGTHIFFNTSRNTIKMGFYCRDKEFVNQIMEKDDPNNPYLETYSSGIRLKGNPAFKNIKEATPHITQFVGYLGGIPVENSPVVDIPKEKNNKVDNNKASKKNTKCTKKISGEAQELSFQQVVEDYKNGNKETVNKWVEAGNPELHFSEEGNILTNELISYVLSYSNVDERIINVIEHGADINACIDDADKYTACHIAVFENKIEILTYLIKNGANVNAVGSDGLTPLFFAAINGYIDAVKLLIDAGADLHKRYKNTGLPAVNVNGGTAMHASFINSHFKTSILLLEKGSDIKELLEPCPDVTPPAENVFSFVKRGYEEGLYNDFDEKLFALIQEKAEKTVWEESISNDAQELSFNQVVEDYKNGNMDTAIQWVKAGNPQLQYNNEDLITNELISYVSCFDNVDESIIRVIEQGADINACTDDTDKYTACHFAAWDNKIEILTYLINNGADVNPTGSDGLTPLYLAAVMGNEDVVKLLVEAGAYIQKKYQNTGLPGMGLKGGTVMRASFINGHFSISFFLIEKGSDIKELLEPCLNETPPAENVFSFVWRRHEEGVISSFDPNLFNLIRKKAEGINNGNETNEQLLQDMAYIAVLMGRIDGEFIMEELTEVSQVLLKFGCKDSSQFESLIQGSLNKINESAKNETMTVDAIEKMISIRENITKEEMGVFVTALSDIALADGEIHENEKGYFETLEPYFYEDDDNNNSSSLDEDEELGYPLLRYRDTEENKQYIKNYIKPTKILNRRMGIKILIPDWVEMLSEKGTCWPHTEAEIETINNGITTNKVIPILRYWDYREQKGLREIKHLWWLVPCVLWKGDIISWIAINKNGFYAPLNDNNEVSLILSWDNIVDIDFDEESLEDPTMNVMDIEMDQGGTLSIYEFIEAGKGSYLSVLYSVYQVRKETIEASKGASTWKEGFGGEGFRDFPDSTELSHLPYWSDEEVSRPNPDAFA